MHTQSCPAGWRCGQAGQRPGGAALVAEVTKDCLASLIKCRSAHVVAGGCCHTRQVIGGMGHTTPLTQRLSAGQAFSVERSSTGIHTGGVSNVAQTFQRCGNATCIPWAAVQRQALFIKAQHACTLAG
jgi:hypothetical protein